MKASQYVRDPAKVYSAIQLVGDQIVAVKPIKMQIPARFPQRDLAGFDSDPWVVGIYALIVEDKYYATSVLCAPVRVEPTLVNKVVVDDVEYMELSFEPGALVCRNINLVKIDNLMYRINDELVFKGRVPWYLTYEQLGNIFETSKRHAGVTIGSNAAVFQVIASTINRSPDDPKTYYRQVLTGRADLDRVKPTVIPLRAVSYGATNAIAKILGSYFDENITSALVYPSERVEHIESLLR